MRAKPHHVARLIVLLVCLLTAVGCSNSKKRLTLAEKVRGGHLTIGAAFDSAMEQMYKRNYLKARDYLRTIETQGADTSFFPKAKLAIADSYFFDSTSTYIEASVEYKSFLTHFPNHEDADYAMYQYAMCFFTEIESADRDQTSTFTAYTEFKNLIDKYPNSPYAVKAKDKIDLCLTRLADHEFSVGYYYFRRGDGFELSAESRLKYIVDNYEGQFDEIKVFFYLAETLWRRGKYDEAIRYYRYLNENGSDSEYQPFVLDKLARYERIDAGEDDPGSLEDELAAQ